MLTSSQPTPHTRQLTRHHTGGGGAVGVVWDGWMLGGGVAESLVPRAPERPFLIVCFALNLTRSACTSSVYPSAFAEGEHTHGWCALRALGDVEERHRCIAIGIGERPNPHNRPSHPGQTCVLPAHKARTHVGGRPGDLFWRLTWEGPGRDAGH